jgi:hypothetical protein
VAVEVPVEVVSTAVRQVMVVVEMLEVQVVHQD